MINKDKVFLYIISLGIIELSLALVFSSGIWIGLFDHDYYVPTIINLVLFEITLLYTVWQFFKRKKAKAYLFGLVIRIFFIGSVFIIYQIGFFAFDYSSLLSNVCLATSFIVYIIAIVYWIFKEKKLWELTLNVLQKSGKLNIKRRCFRMQGGFYSATDKPSNPSKKGTIAGYTIVGGIFLLKLLEMYMGEIFMNILLRVGFIFMSYLMGMIFGKILLWTKEICKLEKKLGIEFVTEFGETEHPKIRDGKQNKL